MSPVQIGLANVLGAAVLAAAVFAVGQVVRRPALLHTLWLLVLLKLVTPPLWPVPVPIPDADWESLQRCVGRHLTFSAPRAGGAAEPAPYLPTAGGWLALLGLVWAVGAGVWWVRAWVSLWRFNEDLHATAWRAPPELRRLAQRFARRLGLRRCPSVWLVSAPLPPMVWTRLGPPRLYFPAALLGRLDADGRAALLAHELAHVVRRDHWVRWLEFVVGGLYWWCPLIGWVRGQLHQCEEESCDAWVVSELPPRPYAAAVLATLDFLAATGGRVPAMASGLGRGAALKKRLTQIMSRTTPKTVSRPGWLVVAVVAGALPLTPSLPRVPPTAPAGNDPPGGAVLFAAADEMAVSKRPE